MKKKKEEVLEEKEKCECNCDCGCGSENCTCGDECNCNEECNCGCNCCNENISKDEEEILLLKNTIENLNNKILTSQAELINYRKRKDEEVSQMMRFANKDLIMDLLPILDNFERALSIKNESKEFDKYSEGYKILYNHLVDTLKKFGVQEIEALDKEFDPNLHEAVMIGNDETKENDIILEVFSKGYILKDRVIRASKVRVNKID